VNVEPKGSQTDPRRYAASSIYMKWIFRYSNRSC